jgi:hypothetical protein
MENRDPDAPFAYPHPSFHPLGTPFWAQDPSILFRENALANFFPSGKLTITENLNAVVRLTFYLGIILSLYSRSAFYLWIPVCGLIITYLIFHFYPNKQELFKDAACAPCSPENLLEKKRRTHHQLDREIARQCVRPTVDNPFMNFNYITDSYHRPPGCRAWIDNTNQTREVKKEVKDSFNYNLYRDVGDLYGKRNSQREFFTMPWTTWPNDQTSFAKWLYQTGPTCKELGLKCAPYWNPYATYSKLEDNAV